MFLEYLEVLYHSEIVSITNSAPVLSTPLLLFNVISVWIDFGASLWEKRESH